MEQKLYEHDRSFADRVRSHRGRSGRPIRSAVAIFVVGFAVVLVSFRSSLVIATFGFLVMLLAALLFERGSRGPLGPRDAASARPASSGQRPHADLGHLGRRLRSRFRPR